MHPLFQKITFENKDFIIMRDDLSHPILSGNKARKLAYLLNNPDKYSHIRTIVSFGGNQSNFMLALSQLAKIKKWDFHYWVKPLPKFLKHNKNGNLKSSLANGMKLFETTETLNLDNIQKNYYEKNDIANSDNFCKNKTCHSGYWIQSSTGFDPESPSRNKEILNQVQDDSVETQYSRIDYSIYFFDQGGRNHLAEQGIAECANEIKNYTDKSNLQDYSVIVASGTGTTALYLEKYLPNRVYTIPCVGDSNYLKKQFNEIDMVNSDDFYKKACHSGLDPESLSRNQEILNQVQDDSIGTLYSRTNYNKLTYPKILEPNFKTSFGQLDIENYNIYKNLLDQTNIEFDLLYDPIAWRTLLEYYDQLPKPVIYIHCGGTSGNETMIARYKRFLENY